MDESNQNQNNGFSKATVISNFIWRFGERVGAQLVSLVVSIVLARLLAPSDYGTITMVYVFLTILQVFIDSGLGQALIQKKDADDIDFSSVFYFNMFMCIVLYAVLFFCAPLIAKFYKMPDLTAVTRVIGITLIISGVKGIQQSYVTKNMLFKKFFVATLGGTIFSAVLGIFMAYKGFGVWALVAQYLSNNLIDTIILWIMVKWRPKFLFSFSRLKILFGFGWKILLSSLIDTGYNQLRSLIIGKVYSASDLAYYNKAKQFPNLIIENVHSSISSVLFPTMSKVQDSKESVKAITRRSMTISTYIMAPMLIGLAVCGKAFISILLTEKWVPCVPYMIIFCITYIFYPLHAANLSAIKALGRSDLFLKLEIIKKIVGIAAILITFKISVMAMAYSLFVISVLSQIINSWPNKKLMDYSYLEQLKDILPGIGLAGFMGVCVYCVNFLNLNNWLTLIVQVPLGAIIYIGLSALLKLEAFTYCLNMVKPIINKLINRKKSVEE